MDSPSLGADLPPVHSLVLGVNEPSEVRRHPTFVLLHGWQKSLDALRPLGELLAENARVVLIDLPGFGRSPLPGGASNEGGGWSTGDYAERVRQVLVELEIDDCILVGHSFGGRISVRLTHRYPEIVRGVVLIGSHGIPRIRSAGELLKSRMIRLLVNTSKQVDALVGSKLFAKHVSPRFGSRDYLAAGDLRRTLVKTVNEDLSTEASTIAAPTLLLWGANDKETPVDIARTYNRLIKKSALHIFPNKGHEPYADVGAHLLATYIERFVSGIEVSS